MLRPPIRIGPRTIKTAAAVIIAMVIVHFYGTTTSRLTFAMLGAMAAVEPTFKDSLRSCMAQIVGVLFGSLVGVLLLAVLSCCKVAGDCSEQERQREQSKKKERDTQ
jgi:uncharacterized membrane protein YgaE (UPF0421/DUF939 family)